VDGLIVVNAVEEDQTMFVQTRGDARSPALLLLHSVVPDPVSYERLGALLSERFHVLSPDRPGYGRSPRLEPFTWAGMAEAVEIELSRRGVTNVVIIAHSISTYEALDLALRGRLRVRGLYLMGALAGHDAPIREAYVAMADQLRKDRAMVERALVTESFEPRFAEEHPELARRLYEDLAALDTEALALQLEAIGVLPDLRPELHRISVPIVLRTGSSDTVTPPVYARLIAEAIRGAEVEEVTGARHLLLLDDEAGTVRSIQAFLERHGFENGG
jgi:pimeloyl-ACP methyl ester carboxylesterase